jgi:hypothetical protein
MKVQRAHFHVITKRRKGRPKKAAAAAAAPTTEAHLALSKSSRSMNLTRSPPLIAVAVVVGIVIAVRRARPEELLQVPKKESAIDLEACPDLRRRASTMKIKRPVLDLIAIVPEVPLRRTSGTSE